jgi:hypothetical protein
VKKGKVCGEMALDLRERHSASGQQHRGRQKRKVLDLMMSALHFCGCMLSTYADKRQTSSTHLGASVAITCVELSGFIPLLSLIFQSFKSCILPPKMFIGMYSKESFIKVSQKSYGIPSAASQKRNIRACLAAAEGSSVAAQDLILPCGRMRSHMASFGTQSHSWMHVAIE